MKKTTLLFLSMLCISFSVFAQALDTKKVYEYKIHSNDPESDAPNLCFQLSPVTISYSNASYDMGYALGGYYLINNVVKLGASIGGSYFNNLGTYSPDNTTEGITPVNGKTQNSFFNLDVAVFFINNTVQKDRMHTVSSSGNTEYVMKLPTNVLVLHGAHIGFTSSRTFVSSYNENPIAFDNVALVDPSDGTMLSRSVLNIGYIRRSSVNINYTVKDVGDRQSYYNSEFYADILLGVSMKLDDVLYYQLPVNYNDPMIVSQHSVNDLTKTSSFGLRVGYTHEIYGSSVFGASVNGEAGFMPGLANSLTNSFYVAAKVSAALNFKVGQ